MLLTRQSLLASPHQQKRGTYFIQTWGCQMNEEDSEQMAISLQSIGFEQTSSMEEAHVILLNTCSVRRKPEDKAFSMLGELVPLKRKRPSVVLGVCGCMAQLRADEIRKRAPHVDFVVGTGQVNQIPGLVEETLHRRRFQKLLDLPERRGAIVEDVPGRAVGKEGKLKTFVPIQYGCDKFCSFCIVPTTRGRERSRPTQEIIEEVAKLAQNGTREVTLLGQTVNSYGKNLPEGRVAFSELLCKLAEIPQLERIRYTSPYPRDFKSDLIECIRDNPKVMEHCHMPLQAGNNDLLKRMKRLYTIESFTDIVDEMRATVPGIALTTDIIVGYPGETEEEFEGTMEAMRRIRFDGAYMFIYSPRPGTPAAELEQIPKEVKSRRHLALAELQNQISCEINETYIGRDLEVLVEGPSPKNPELLQGFSREYKMVHFPGPSDLRGRTVPVRAMQSHLWGLTGQLA